MNQRKNLILCLAAGYSIEKIEPFLASWREHVASAELAMFVANVGLDFMEQANRLGVTLLDAQPGLAAPYHVQTARYFMYRDYLRDHAQEYDSVLLTDVRDVVFQADPFDVERTAPVSFAAEDQVLSACPWNTDWLSKAYGEAVATELADRTISCSGTTIGDMQGILAYLDLLCGEAEQHPAIADVTGLDQGFHNYILWKLEPDFVRLDTDDRIVNTLGYTPGDQISVSHEGGIKAFGNASAVVHQWDRHAGAEDFVRSRYNLADHA